MANSFVLDGRRDFYRSLPPVNTHTSGSAPAATTAGSMVLPWMPLRLSMASRIAAGESHRLPLLGRQRRLETVNDGHAAFACCRSYGDVGLARIPR